MDPSSSGVAPDGFRDALRTRRFLLPELLVAAAMLAAGFAGILPLGATPFLITFGVLSLWLRGEGPRAVGLAFRPAGNVHFLLISLAVAWTLAAFGEEFVYRGYLLTRVAQALGDGSRAWLGALALTSILFGVGHGYQGLSGMISAGLGGLVFGALYLATGRNLWVSVIAHGTTDTVGFLLLYLGKYPGS